MLKIYRHENSLSKQRCSTGQNVAAADDDDDDCNQVFYST